MKRGLLLGFLLLSVGAVAYLLMYSSGEHAGGRRALSDEARRAATDSDSLDPGAEAVGGVEGSGGRRSGRGADNDPNRIPGPPLTIRGVVMKGEKPAVDAQVALFRALARNRATANQWERRQFNRSPPELARVKCDKQGRFTMEVARRSELMIFADAPGAAFAWLKLRVPAKGDTKEITIQLGDGDVLAGKVVDAKKEPVAGATIVCAYYDWQTSSLALDAVTNREGLFRFEGLRQGTYYVTVTATGFPAQRRQVKLPDTRELLFELVPGGSLAGRVANGRGDAIVGATLLFQTGDAWMGKTGLASVTTDGNGEYRIPHVLVGPLRGVVLEHSDYGVRSSSQQQIRLPTDVIAVDKEMRFDITLPTGVTVRGIVVAEDTNKPIADADIKLLRMSKSFSSLADIGVVSSGPDGRFEFLHVEEGTYGLEAQSQFAMRSAQRAANSRTPLTIDFFVDGVTPPDEQRLVMSATGTVRGTMDGVTPATYRAINLNLTVGDVNRNVRVDAYGTFEFAGVPPTPETTIRSWNPAVTSDPFEVKAGEIVEIELNPAAQGSWGGVVTNSDGNPIARATVHAMLQSQIKQQLRMVLFGYGGAVRTDSQGRFRIPIHDNVRKTQSKQKWVIAAVHAEYEMSISDAVEMPPPGQDSEVALELTAGGSVSGMVIAEHGGSAANVRVTVYPKREKGQPYETRATRNASTDIDGSFHVTGVGQGNYRVSVWAPGGQAETLEARAGDTNLRLVITSAASLGGVVVDPDGFPIQNGQVGALGSNGKRISSGSISSGRFRIWNLKPGAYELEASPNNRRNNRGTSFEKTKVGPYATGNENVLIKVSWGNTMEGRVIGSGGRPAGGITVIAMPLKVTKTNRRSSRPVAITNGRGEFTLKGMGKEEVELIAGGPGYQSATTRAAPGSKGITLQLTKGAVVEGKILKPDGKPLPNQWFNLQPVSPELQKKLRDMQRRMGNQYYGGIGNSVMSGRTDGQGVFRLNSLVPGRYKMVIRSEHGVAPQDIILQTGAGKTVIELKPALTVSGIVVGPDGGPPETDGRRMLYVNARQGKQWFGGAQVGGDGTFELKGLPAGNLTVTVYGGTLYQNATAEATAGSSGVRIVLVEKVKRQR